MIAMLTGRLESANAGSAIVDVGGVGYLVYASARTLDHMPGAGETVRLLIETHVRQDHIHLYGFLDAGERDWFRYLLTVQGVGARMALAVLSALRPEELAQAIAAEDKARITRADGVGPKLATRIVTELKDRVGELALARAAAVEPAGGAGAAGAAGKPAGDAVSALVNLGYARTEAFGAVSRATHRLGPEATVEALIRTGLQELAA